jgi:hypothetical protein
MKLMQLSQPYGLTLDNQCFAHTMYRGAAKSLARPGRKQATASEDFEFHISYL